MKNKIKEITKKSLYPFIITLGIFIFTYSILSIDYSKRCYSISRQTRTCENVYFYEYNSITKTSAGLGLSLVVLGYLLNKRKIKNN